MGKRLVGKASGHVERISMTGPASHENAGVRDQPVTLVMTLNRVDRMEPATTEILLERTGLEDEAELKTKVREMLVERAGEEQRQALHKQVAEQPARPASNWSCPRASATARSSGTTSVGGCRCSWAARARRRSATRSPRPAARAKGGRPPAEGLLHRRRRRQAAGGEVGQNEVNGRVYQIAMQQNRRFEKVRQEMGNRGEIEQLYLSIREGKTLHPESATITGADGGR